MYDIEVGAPRGARSLVLIGHVLGEAGISLEGGGMWGSVAHYLVAEGPRAAELLTRAGLGDVTVRRAVLAELDADVPGALGRMMLALEQSGVELVAQYSDHDNRKVLVTDDPQRAAEAVLGPTSGT